jgi:hypothetical protein
MKSFKNFILERDTKWGTWNSPKWRRDEDEWHSNRYTGLEDRLKNDPVARLGAEVARNPKSGTIDTIDDIDSGGKESNLHGQLSVTYSPKTGDVYKDKIRVRTDMPSRETGPKFEPLEKPTVDYQRTGDVIGHELGHLGQHISSKAQTAGDPNAEIEQRWRDVIHASPTSSQFQGSSQEIIKHSTGNYANKYKDWKFMSDQLPHRPNRMDDDPPSLTKVGVPSIVSQRDQQASDILNDPKKLQKAKSTYWSDDK